MTELLIPILAAGLALSGLWRRVPVFDRFVAGAKEGGQSAVRLIPTLIGLLLAVNTLGVLSLLTSLAGLPEVDAVTEPREIDLEELDGE